MRAPFLRLSLVTILLTALSTGPAWAVACNSCCPRIVHDPAHAATTTSNLGQLTLMLQEAAAQAAATRQLLETIGSPGQLASDFAVGAVSGLDPSGSLGAAVGQSAALVESLPQSFGGRPIDGQRLASIGGARAAAGEAFALAPDASPAARARTEASRRLEASQAPLDAHAASLQALTAGEATCQRVGALSSTIDRATTQREGLAGLQQVALAQIEAVAATRVVMAELLRLEAATALSRQSALAPDHEPEDAGLHWPLTPQQQETRTRVAAVDALIEQTRRMLDHELADARARTLRRMGIDPRTYRALPGYAGGDAAELAALTVQLDGLLVDRTLAARAGIHRLAFSPLPNAQPLIALLAPAAGPVSE